MEGGEEKEIDAISGLINDLNLLATLLPVNHSKVKNENKTKRKKEKKYFLVH